MIRCHILVEGQTEETFTNRLLVPHLAAADMHIRPVLLTTKRLPSGGKFGGGVSRWKRIHSDLRCLLGDSNAFVTTMLDYYRLPEDVPGMADRPGGNARARIEHIEQRIRDSVGDSRFVPHLMLHEFETLLFAAPEACGAVSGDQVLASHFAAITEHCGGPEQVDDGPDTAPSKRVATLWPTYRKTADGPMVAERAGLATLRLRCPHFDRWITRLEDISSGTRPASP